MEEEECKGYAGELVDPDNVVWVDVGKVQNSWYEDVDLEPFEVGFITIGAPVQDLPLILGVSRLDSEESIVLLAKSLLDALRTAGVRREAKDINVLT